MKRFILPILAMLAVSASVRADDWSVSQLSGMSNAVANATTITTCAGVINLKHYDSVSLVATGKLSTTGTTPLVITAVAGNDGTNYGSNVIVSWSITPNGTTMFSVSTNIPPTAVNPYGYLKFTTIQNPNSAILSNFGIAYGLKHLSR